MFRRSEYNEDEERSFPVKKVVIGAIAVVLGMTIARQVVVIPTGYTGVVTTMGRVEENTMKSGTVNLKTPFIQSVHKINNKQQNANMNDQVWGETKDKTPVYAQDIVVTFQILPDKAAYLYSTVSDMNSIFTGSLISSAIKDAMVTFEPSEVTIRSNVEPVVRDNLNRLLADRYGDDAVYVNQVTIGSMDFQDAYNDAIQKKSIAQQTKAAQEIENETAIKKAEADKQVAITNAEAAAETKKIEAEAEAEANKKLANSISDVLVEYQKVQKWNGKLPTVTGGSAIIDIGTADSSDISN